MNAKALIPLVAGLGVGGFALKLGLDTVKRAQGSQPSVDKVQIWAAQTDIPRGTKISEEMIKAMPFPPQLAPEGSFQGKKELVGRVPRVDAPAGLPLLENMLHPPGTIAGLHPKPGFRAVAVKIDESSGVDYHLEPGSFVDVVGSFTVRRDRRQETIAKVILENVQVAAVGPRLSPVSPSEDGERSSKRAVRAVTLFVKPEDVPSLLLTEQKGRIKLSLRNDADSGRVQNRAAATESALIEGTPEKVEVVQEQAEKAPEKSWIERLQAMFPQPKPGVEPGLALAPPDPPWVVVIYHGQDQETVRFKNRTSRVRVGEEEPGASLFGPAQRPTMTSNPPESRVSRPKTVEDKQKQESEAEPEEPSE